MLEVQKRLPWWRLFLLSLAQETSVDTGHNQQWEAPAVVIDKIRQALRASQVEISGALCGLH